MGNLAEGLGEFHSSCGFGTTHVSVFLAKHICCKQRVLSLRKYNQRLRYSNRVWLAHLPSVDPTPEGTNSTKAKAHTTKYDRNVQGGKM